MRKTLCKVLGVLLLACFTAFVITACQPASATKYTVTYDKGNAEVTGSAPVGGSYEEGEIFTLAANPFTTEDYQFLGWNDGTTTYEVGAAYTMPAHDVTFTAQWTSFDPDDKWLVEFSLDGQIIVGLGVYVEKGSAIGTLPDESDSRIANIIGRGGIFEGWYENSDFEGDAVTAAWAPEANTILYGKYIEGEKDPVAHFYASEEEDAAVVNFDQLIIERDSSDAISSVSMQVLPFEDAQRSFESEEAPIGWYYYVGGEKTTLEFTEDWEVVLLYGKTESGLFDELLAEYNFYALWEEEEPAEPVTHTVSYSGGSIIKNIPAAQEYAVGAEITLPQWDSAWVRTADFLYTSGWEVQHHVNGSSIWTTFEAGPIAFGGTYTMPDEDIRFNLVWENVTVNLVFDLNDPDASGNLDGLDNVTYSFVYDSSTTIWIPTVDVTRGRVAPPAGMQFKGWGWTADATTPATTTSMLMSYFYKSHIVVATDNSGTATLTFYAIWEEAPTTEPESDWVEYVGDVELLGYYVDITWLKIDVLGNDLTVTYKLDGASTVYTAAADASKNNEHGLYYSLKDAGVNPYSYPSVYLKVSTDYNTLTVYSADYNSELGTLTRDGGSSGPVEPPVGESKTIAYRHGSNAPTDVSDIFPDVTSAVVGSQVVIPELPAYDVAHYTFKGWDAYKVSGDYDSSIGRVTPGVAFTMPDYPIIFESVFTVNYVTVKFDKNGGDGTMADIVNTYRYGSSTVISVGSKFTNKFTGPEGAAFLYWSTTSNGPQIPDSFAFTESNGVTKEDILTLYAIWDTSSVTPDPDVTLSDYEGVWTNGNGDKLIIILLSDSADGYIAYGYLKTNDSLYDYVLRFEGTEAGLFAATDDDESHDNGDGYTISLANGQLTITVNYSPLPKSYNFTENSNLASTPADTFAGRYTATLVGSTSMKFLFEADGTVYRDNGSSLTRLTWWSFDKYALFLNGTINSSGVVGTWYILEEANGNLVDIYGGTNTTFEQSNFVKLTVDGVLNQLVANGSAATASRVVAAEKAGETFDHWAKNGEKFELSTPLTADTEIVAVYVSAEVPPAPAEGEYTGGSFSIRISAMKSANVTSFTFDESYKNVTLYYADGTNSQVEIEDVTHEGWLSSWIPSALPGAVAIYEMQDSLSNSYYFCFYDESKNSVKVYDEDDTFLAEFSKTGAELPPEEPETGVTYVGDLTFQSKTGTKIQITKLVVDEDAGTVIITYSRNDAAVVTSDPITLDKKSAGWAPGSALSYYYVEGIQGISFGIALYADDTLLVCDSSDDGEITASNRYVTYIAGSARFTKGGGDSSATEYTVTFYGDESEDDEIGSITYGESTQFHDGDGYLGLNTDKTNYTFGYWYYLKGAEKVKIEGTETIADLIAAAGLEGTTLKVYAYYTLSATQTLDSIDRNGGWTEIAYLYPEALKAGDIITISGDLTIKENADSAKACWQGIFVNFISANDPGAVRAFRYDWFVLELGTPGWTVDKTGVTHSWTLDTTDGNDWPRDLERMMAAGFTYFSVTVHCPNSNLILVTYTLKSNFTPLGGSAGEYTFVSSYQISGDDLTGTKLALIGEWAKLENATATRGCVHDFDVTTNVCSRCGAMRETVSSNTYQAADYPTGFANPDPISVMTEMVEGQELVFKATYATNSDAGAWAGIVTQIWETGKEYKRLNECTFQQGNDYSLDGSWVSSGRATRGHLIPLDGTATLESLANTNRAGYTYEVSVRFEGGVVTVTYKAWAGDAVGKSDASGVSVFVNVEETSLTVSFGPDAVTLADGITITKTNIVNG